MNVRMIAAIVIAASAATSAFADGDHDYPHVAQNNGPVSNTIVERAPVVSPFGSAPSEGKCFRAGASARACRDRIHNGAPEQTHVRENLGRDY